MELTKRQIEIIENVTLNWDDLDFEFDGGIVELHLGRDCSADREDALRYVADYDRDLALELALTVDEQSYYGGSRTLRWYNVRVVETV